MADEEDNRIKCAKTWIKWIDLEDGTSMKYGDKMFVNQNKANN